MIVSASLTIALSENHHRVKTWHELGRPAPMVGQFMGVSLYNKATGFGAITNYLNIDALDIEYIRSLQDEPVEKKMNWLFGDGKIFFNVSAWETAHSARWGTLAIGGNVVRVVDYEWIDTKLPNETEARRHAFARLDGFRKADIGKPRRQLIHEGKVHRVHCIYPSGAIGDSPQGAAYMPFYAPEWDFSGTAQPESFYLPTAWLK